LLFAGITTIVGFYIIGTARLRRVSCQRKSCRAACQGGGIHFRLEGEAMPTQEELRRAMAARAERKELEEARVAHDTKVRGTWIESYREEKKTLRRKESLRRAADKAKRERENEAARQLDRSRAAQAERMRADRENAERRTIANEVAQRVPHVTAEEVLREMARLRAKGRTASNWTAYMTWWMRNRA